MTDGTPAAIRITTATIAVIARPIARVLPDHSRGGSFGWGTVVGPVGRFGRLDWGWDFAAFRRSDIFRSDNRRSFWSAESRYRTAFAGFFACFARTRPPFELLPGSGD